MTVTATSTPYYSYSTSNDSAQATFDLSFLNPCFDSEFVTISPYVWPTIPIDYEIDSGLKEYQHDQFIVTTSPLVGHDFCGVLEYGAYYNFPVVSNPVDFDSLPFGYDSANFKIKIFEDDPAFIDDVVPFEIRGSFKNWPKDTNNPNAQESRSIALINYLSGCNNLVLTPPTLTDPSPDSYSGS